MILKYCLLVIIWPVLNSCAQNASTPKPLNVGDTIPYIILTDVINFPVSKIHLSEFKDKVIILGFWATWCGSCHIGFPKADSLQEQFKDQVQFIMVNSINGTGDSAAKIRAFFDNWNNKHLTRFRLPTVMEDTITKSLFPRTYLPHYVWIGANGKVAAITSSEEVTAENIIAILNGLPITMNDKKRRY